MNGSPFLVICFCFCFPLRCVLLQAQTPYTSFEPRLTHPLGQTPDGTRLLALNSSEGSLSIFDISNAANPTPVLIAEIPVGLAPVSLAARTNDEIWVVNEVSDSVSIVSISSRCVVRTLAVPDEPADVVFTPGQAFVSCARSNTVRVFDTTNFTQTANITLLCNYPRAMVADVAGGRIFVASQLSGNKTTVLPAALAPNQPAPTNAALPAAPKTALIVPSNDSRINFTVLDNDVAEIDTSTHTVTRYFTGVGTNLFDMAMAPAGGSLFIPNTDALNLTRFEPNLRGHFVDNRLSRVSLTSGLSTAFDLNPGINYALLPNPSAQTTALAQPTAVVLTADGSAAWVAAFGSDRLAKIDTTTGSVLARVDVRTPPDSGANDSRKMRGPRGLLLHANGRIYALNKLSNTVSVIDATSNNVVQEIPTGSYDPMPAAIKEGRGFLFDARLSGNGTMSCASCHLDADRDGLAWDLGDPGGSMLTVVGYNNSIHDLAPKSRTIHPMKGPLTTQTLRGFRTGQAFHWRGDKPTLQSFNSTFDKLMGGSQIPAPDMDAMASYLGTLILHANPNRNLDRSLQTSFAGGNPTNGRDMYNTHTKSHCAVCHILPTGSDNNIDLNNIVGSTQPVKTPHLRTVYQRAVFNPSAGAININGFGLLKDGTGFDLPIAHFYDLENFATLQEFTDVKAFVLSFDTGTAPAVGSTLTANAGNVGNANFLANLAILEGQAQVANTSDLVVQGRVGGELRRYVFDKTTQRYFRDKAGTASLTRSELLALIVGDSTLSFQGTLPGDGARLGPDRDGDGIKNSDEPLPALDMSILVGGPIVRWPRSATDWFLEASTDLKGPWVPVNTPRTFSSNHIQCQLNPSGEPHSFYRLRRTW